jgi:predicted phosphoadenosine phosphosulfate sulfurtransferase
MYLDYSTYQMLTLDAMPENEFEFYEPDAETYLDQWTHDRIRSLDTVPASVERVMARLVDGIKELNGDQVVSYSNGVDSWSFVKQDDVANLYSMAVRILPVELVSACV